MKLVVIWYIINVKVSNDHIIYKGCHRFSFIFCVYNLQIHLRAQTMAQHIPTICTFASNKLPFAEGTGAFKKIYIWTFHCLLPLWLPLRTKWGHFSTRAFVPSVFLTSTPNIWSESLLNSSTVFSHEKLLHLDTRDHSSGELWKHCGCKRLLLCTHIWASNCWPQSKAQHAW